MVNMVLDEGHHPGDTGDMRDRVRRWINEETIQTAGEFDFPGLLTKSVHVLSEPFGVTADEFDIFSQAPFDLLRIVKAEILDPTVSPVRLFPMKALSYNDFRRTFIADSSTSTTRADRGSPARPTRIAFRRIEGVDLHGVTGSPTWRVSSGAATEAATLKVTLAGYTLATHPRVVKTQNSAMITSTPQSLSAMAEPFSFSKNDVSTGVLILDDGTTNRAFIDPWEFSAFRTEFLLHPFRDRTDYTLYLSYKHRPPLMSFDSDVPFGMPYEAWELIRYSALAKILAFIENTGEQEKADRRKNELKAALRTKLSEENIEDAAFAWDSPRLGEFITEMD